MADMRQIMTSVSQLSLTAGRRVSYVTDFVA